MKSYTDIAGDGGSDVLGQVTAQRRAIADALAGVEHVVAVASGKGGVGKSTVTAALARALLARPGVAPDGGVTILDADFNGPTQAHMAGLTGVPWVPGDDARLAVPRRPDGLGVVSFGSLLGAAEELRFDTVSKGEQHTWRATREFALLAQLLSGVAWGEQHALLFDLPPGAERTVQYAQFFEAALGAGRVGFVLVTVPSDLSRGVVARSLTALRATGSPVVGYVENMAGYLCPGCGDVQPLFPSRGDAGEALDLPLLARIPFDPELAAHCDRGWPGDHHPPAVEALASVAELLAAPMAAATSDPRSEEDHP